MSFFLADSNLYQMELPQQTELGLASETSFGWVVFTTLFLCTILIAVLWLVKKWLNKEINLNRAMYRIQILERKAVSQKTVLYLIKVDGEKLLLSESQLQVDVLHKGEIKPFVNPCASTPSKAGSNMLNKARNPSDLSLQQK